MSNSYDYDTGYFWWHCELCGEGHRRRDMNRILIQFGPYGSPKKMAYVCQDCSPKIADFLGIALPEDKRYVGIHTDIFGGVPDED